MTPRKAHMLLEPFRIGHPRRGAVLIIVLGLAMVLLGLAVTFTLRMRADSEETRIVLAEAQSRLMLHAGLMFLQEESRLGWGKETFGWTDVRDGSLGPRPARDCSTATGNGLIPVPTWWTLGTYKPWPLDTDLPASPNRIWPCPGSVIRCPMAVPVQPPYATQLRYAYNPVGFPAGAPTYGQPGWETPWVPNALGVDPVQQTRSGATLPTASYWPIAWTDNIFNRTNGATAALDPQPQADKWSDPTYVGNPGQKPDFISGAIDQFAPATGDWWHIVDDGISTHRVQLKVRPGTDNQCWFRIYREVLADHDGSGTPAYNRVVMYDPTDPNKAAKNWNVFIVACGTGPTRGYRFWDQTEASTWESLNGYASNTVCRGQDFASNSNLFSNQQDFHDKLASTHVLWFRVEWSALQGGGFVPERYAWAGMRIYPRSPIMQPRPFPGWNAHANPVNFDEQNSDRIIVGATLGGYADGLGYSAPKTYGGNFKWVQRLDHEPPNW